MTTLEVMKESTHALLQRGHLMCTYDHIHPPSVRDMTNAYDTNATQKTKAPEKTVKKQTKTINLWSILKFSCMLLFTIQYKFT